MLVPYYFQFYTFAIVIIVMTTCITVDIITFLVLLLRL